MGIELYRPWDTIRYVILSVIVGGNLKYSNNYPTTNSDQGLAKFSTEG